MVPPAVQRDWVPPAQDVEILPGKGVRCWVEPAAVLQVLQDKVMAPRAAADGVGERGHQALPVSSSAPSPLAHADAAWQQPWAQWQESGGRGAHNDWAAPEQEQEQQELSEPPPGAWLRERLGLATIKVRGVGSVAYPTHQHPPTLLLFSTICTQLIIFVSRYVCIGHLPMTLLDGYHAQTLATLLLRAPSMAQCPTGTRQHSS